MGCVEGTGATNERKYSPVSTPAFCIKRRGNVLILSAGIRKKTCREDFQLLYKHFYRIICAELSNFTWGDASEPLDLHLLGYDNPSLTRTETPSTWNSAESYPFRQSAWKNHQLVSIACSRPMGSIHGRCAIVYIESRPAVNTRNAELPVLAYTLDYA